MDTIMHPVLLIAVLLFAGLSDAFPTPHKIVGGSAVNKGDHPYQIHLQMTLSVFGIFEMTRFGCGGSIISDRWILTAAHCIKDYDGRTTLKPSKMLVRVGQHDSSLLESHARNYKVLQVIEHPKFNPDTMANDVALLEVETIAFTEYVQPIGMTQASPVGGDALTVSGWGHTTSGGQASEVLLSVEVQAVDTKTCNAPASYGGQVVSGMFCAAGNGKDSCQGDSGGPIVSIVDGVHILMGVVSWGFGCAGPDHPGVYVDVAYFNQWIYLNSGVGPVKV
ncbi:trypsin alpha-3-like [Paramacrobiotus metropolitanus]|uniref:trypsin alpha-3-like n=1 Tax=Paramacrobiotus metropolitanus TaxID=2943436 RepID=UPI0024459ADA|nr:trypsin alpha-3-like [Paramacrobiotus metropolitanus]